MAETKTRPTGSSVEAYIAERATPTQAEDCRQLIALFQRLSGAPPVMWGPSIVGFSRYRYVYESGHSGESPRIGFAIRGRELVLYVVDCDGPHSPLLAQLGKHRMSKSCLYFKKLADLDAVVLERLVRESLAQLETRHGQAG